MIRRIAGEKQDETRYIFGRCDPAIGTFGCNVLEKCVDVLTLFLRITDEHRRVDAARAYRVDTYTVFRVIQCHRPASKE